MFFLKNDLRMGINLSSLAQGVRGILVYYNSISYSEAHFYNSLRKMKIAYWGFPEYRVVYGVPGSYMILETHGMGRRLVFSYPLSHPQGALELNLRCFCNLWKAKGSLRKLRIMSP